MKIKRLIRDLPDLVVKGSKDVEITGICGNSKTVAPGNLFVAKKGLTHHGSRFIPEAIAAGASAVLTDIFDPFLTGVVQLIHPDVASIEAHLAAIFYENPVDKLFLVGITGTNGKTTTSYLVKHLLEGSKLKTGLIGTVEWLVGERRLPSQYTTPDLLTNYRLFHEMVESGCKAAVMEVASHALDQERVKDIEFDVAVFTNLTQDHLDYHKTMESYAEAKAKLFRDLGQVGCNKHFRKVAIVNADSSYSSQLVEDCSAECITYGIDTHADLLAKEIRLSSQGIEFELQYKGKRIPFRTSLIGRFNLYNCLAALAVAVAYGMELEAMVPLLASFKSVRGRLERVENRKKMNIFVDYAHTEDALKNVLNTLREFKKGRLITVFGCGGNRDVGKRPKMGSAVELLSDLSIITSDNPRSEDPEEIAKQILGGFRNPTAPMVVLDRKEAIRKALQLAAPEDIVLIAGKGHETTQIFAHQTLHFDDYAVAKAEVET
ncbi:MAG: UDP-N-acetylmuramoyl-L-alanyl-D-glutamate--2,6-diaminopimelate ligase [Chlamydiales bacterium]|nr:UDP-N-acetylmuramoyl-L-alanyl-D-glutamate--2,6-diaminopimelate ligase [Chlamydiales bacterium]